MKDGRKIIPDTTPTDHITKQGVYSYLLKQGASEQAQKAFRREPYYMTAARLGERRDVKLNKNETLDKEIFSGEET